LFFVIQTYINKQLKKDKVDQSLKTTNI